MDQKVKMLLNEVLDLSDYEKTTLLMHYVQERVRNKTAIDLMRVYEKKLRYFRCSAIPLEHTADCMRTFAKCIANDCRCYDYIDLSPIAPLGMNSIITKLSQSLVGSTIRSSEVIADPTTMLILEAAFRRKQLKRRRSDQGVDLATSCRVLRMQQYKDDKFLQHFSTFALVSVQYTPIPMRDRIRKLKEHVSIYLDYMSEQNQAQYSFGDIEVHFSSMQMLDQILGHMSPSQRDSFRKNTLDDAYHYWSEFGLEPVPVIYGGEDLRYLDPISHMYDHKHFKRVFPVINKYLMTPLRDRYPHVKFGWDLNRKTGHGYYKDLCFSISAKNDNRIAFMLGDGGEVNWASQFLSDNNECAIASGFGLEMSQLHFWKAGMEPPNSGSSA